MSVSCAFVFGRGAGAVVDVYLATVPLGKEKERGRNGERQGGRGVLFSCVPLFFYR